MGEQPQNAASAFVHRTAVILSDLERTRREMLATVTPDFKRYDRRRITSQPTVDAQGWLRAILEFENLTGEWPTVETPEILAVRGDRLCASHWVLRFGESRLEFLIVSQVEGTGENRGELGAFFDPEDLDAAIAELDRLQTQLETGGM